jgi:hypothetical protein
VIRLFYPLRFFHVVGPVTGLIAWTFLAVVIVGAMAIASDPMKAPAAIVPVLVLQVFAASTGFSVPARRGHYDLLLTGGHSRVWMALAHWWASIAPGITAWLAVAGVEVAATAGAHTTLLAFGTCAAMCLVSTLPWAITLRLPRFAGGIGWLLVLATWTSLFPAIGVTVGPVADRSSEVLRLIQSAWSFLVYPLGLVGQPLSSNQVWAATPALILAAGAMVLACRWILRASIPLEAAQ